MKRTSVKIPDEVDARLRYEARRRHTTVSLVIREALEARYGTQAKRRLTGGRVWHSGAGDVSERIEEILNQEWGR